MEDFNAIEILIVEDNPRDAELTQRALKKNNLANDFIFCKGKFNKRTFTNPPKVVLLDLKFPKVSGLEVLKIVKGDKRTSHIPVVVVTSSKQEPDMKEAYELDVNSYVVKPVDFDQFINAMSSLGLY